MEISESLETEVTSVSKEQIAFLYRMSERDVITDKLRIEFRETAISYLYNLVIRLKVELDDKTPQEAIESINLFFDKEDIDTQVPIIYDIANLKSLRGLMINLLETQKAVSTNKLSPNFIEACGDAIEKEIEKLAYQDPNISTKVNNMSYAAACKKYFGQYFEKQNKEEEEFSELRDTGKLYCPPQGKHTWQSNLKWLIECFNRGSEFVVMSELTEKSQYRSSGQLGSGFFREIATCYKLGYKLEEKDQEIVMRHPERNKFKNKIDIDKIKQECDRLKNELIMRLKSSDQTIDKAKIEGDFNKLFEDMIISNFENSVGNKLKLDMFEMHALFKKAREDFEQLKNNSAQKTKKRKRKTRDEQWMKELYSLIPKKTLPSELKTSVSEDEARSTNEGKNKSKKQRKEEEESEEEKERIARNRQEAESTRQYSQQFMPHYITQEEEGLEDAIFGRPPTEEEEGNKSRSPSPTQRDKKKK